MVPLLWNQLFRFEAASGISHLWEQPQRNNCLQEVGLALGTVGRWSALHKLVCTKCLPTTLKGKHGYSFPDGHIRRRIEKSQDVITIQTVMTGFTFRLSSEKFMVLHSFEYRKIPPPKKSNNRIVWRQKHCVWRLEAAFRPTIALTKCHLLIHVIEQGSLQLNLTQVMAQYNAIVNWIHATYS